MKTKLIHMLDHLRGSPFNHNVYITVNILMCLSERCWWNSGNDHNIQIIFYCSLGYIIKQCTVVKALVNTRFFTESLFCCFISFIRAWPSQASKHYKSDFKEECGQSHHTQKVGISREVDLWILHSESV